MAEIGEQNIHQIIVIGIAAIGDHTGQCILDHIIDFIEENTEAEVLDIIRDIMHT